MLYRIPAGGIPEEGIASGEILASRVPVYGTKNAGRGFWLRLENTCKQFKFSLNQILPTLFTLPNDESRIIAVMSSNADDFLYGYLSERAEVMNSVLQQLLVGKEKHGIFRFCGKEFRQDEDFGIHVTATDNTERVQPITHDVKHGFTRKATADEIHQLRSVTQSLAWIARQTRRDLSYRISKIQSTFENACVRCCANVIVLWNMQHLRPRVASTFLRIVSWMMQSSTRSATQVSAKNRSKSTKSLRTSNHNRLVSQPWLLVTPRRCSFTRGIGVRRESEESAAVH